MQKGLRARAAYSTAETVVALILLGVVVTSIGKFSAHVNLGVKDRQLALRLQWEIENAREVIGSWPVSEVNQDRIEKLEVSHELAELLETPRWTATVQSQVIGGKPTERSTDSDIAAASVQATSVRLQLHAGYRGQLIKPVELVFWIIPQPDNGSAGTKTTSELRP